MTQEVTLLSTFKLTTASGRRATVDAVTVARELVDPLTVHTDKLGEDVTVTELAELQQLGEDLRHVAAHLLDTVAVLLRAKLPSKTGTFVPNIGVITQSSSPTKRWADDTASERFRDAVWTAIRDRAAVDPDTGEVTPLAVRIASRAVDVARKTIPAFQTVSKAGAKLTGVDIDDYKTSQWNTTVSLDRGVSMPSVEVEP